MRVIALTEQRILVADPNFYQKDSMHCLIGYFDAKILTVGPSAPIELLQNKSEDRGCSAFPVKDPPLIKSVGT